MNKLVTEVIRNVSNKEISIKKNYKLLRILQKVSNTNILNRNEYEDVVLSLENRDIKCRLFEPNNLKEKAKLIIFIHGGGWVSGSVDTYTKTCIELADKTNRMVVSIDYRLAPEYPYPAGFDDCYDVVKYIFKNCDRIDLNKKDICLMGDSAGGNLCAAISLKAKHTKEFKVYEQILLYPALQSDYSINTKYQSVIDNGNDYLLTRKNLEEYMNLYVEDINDLDSPYVSPLKSKLLFFQPKTMIITADKDPLRDEGKHYAKRLKMFFNKVTYYNVEDAIHGFFTNPLGKKYKEEIYNKIIKFIGDINE